MERRTESIVVENQEVMSADVASYPVGTVFRACPVVVTETLPLGYHFDLCRIKAASDFKGQAVLVFPGDPTEEEAHLLETTAVTNCHIDCRNAKFAVYEPSPLKSGSIHGGATFVSMCRWGRCTIG